MLNAGLVTIPENEIEFTFARSSGPGGQNVNKVNSKALLRWNPVLSPSLPEAMKLRFLERFSSRLTSHGELLITSDRHRNQLRNQEDCLEKLRTMLVEVLHPPKVRRKTKISKGAKERRKTDKRKHGDKKRSRRVVFD